MAASINIDGQRESGRYVDNSSRWYLVYVDEYLYVGNRVARIRTSRFYSGNLDSQDWTPLKCGNPVILTASEVETEGYL